MTESSREIPVNERSFGHCSCVNHYVEGALDKFILRTERETWNACLDECLKLAKEKCLVGEDSWPCDTATEIEKLRKL